MTSFTAAGFEWRKPGCSMCLAMNPDKLVGDEVCASSSNRNFMGQARFLHGTNHPDEPDHGRSGCDARCRGRCARCFSAGAGVMNDLVKRSGRGVYVQGNDIDTDRIIPARFLKCVTFDELGPALCSMMNGLIPRTCPRGISWMRPFIKGPVS